ncbi:MAG: undecaprenyldiphospho-muramoylpentapeptide beta-N-acetylglucosaminyltransferase [Prevotellaceae bacterium]|jgi:UDP-N-acetylglucosamine--N-acetylmuramyl-(pentapeptide) pyrophosphoryl-undecaprenol N-acetylglucosamine transferase|nr:undecaprenyldiphospho-muramoylpentapeptide beta-N-acetylglucosaminyltransferase [Prevotellaceae bacterium]
MHRVIISGGGTGGHVFPAIAIADALREIEPKIEILFVGAEGKMEMEKVPAAGYRIEGLPVAGLQRRLTLKNLSVPFKLAKSLNRAGKILRQFKPDVVAGVGGYASAPVLWKARRMGIPSLIQEQNSYAGLTNKILGRGASVICTAYEGMERFFPADRIILTGNPVRRGLQNVGELRSEAAEFFGFDPRKQTLLVVGGSLGARTLNESVENGLSEVEKAGVQLLWQTGRHYFDRAQQATKKYGDAKARDFIQRMDYAFALADVIVSRAGAGTISELCLVGKPAILVPSPNVAEDHQTKNAEALTRRNAAMMVADNKARNQLVPEALKLLNDKVAKKTLSKNIIKYAKPAAATTIAREIIKLASKP